MKLLILDQFSDPGGAQQCLLDLLPEIRARGWEGLVALPGDGAVFDRVRELGFEAAPIACGPFRPGRKSVADLARFLWQTPRLAREIHRMAERSGADLLYVNGPRVLPAAPSGLPVVFHAHSYIAPGAIRELMAHALRRTNASVIANCEFLADTWRGYVARERVSVIYNGVAGSDCVPAARTGHGPTIACIGRIAPEKGQLDFLRAAQGIHRAIPQARFQIIGAALFGDPTSARYEKAVRGAAAGLPLEFCGWLRNVSRALTAIDLLLVPSTAHEATTRVILEAYAAGVPVVAYRSGGIPEVVEDGATGYLADGVAHMTGLAIDLLRSPTRHAEMSEAARECWLRRFTLERYRRELAQALERAATGRTAPRPPAPKAPRLRESNHILHG